MLLPTLTSLLFYFLGSDSEEFIGFPHEELVESLSSLQHWDILMYNQMNVDNLPKPKLLLKPSHKHYLCTLCSKEFTSEEHLDKHMELQCCMSQRYKCPYCTHRSSESSSIYRHVRRKHPGRSMIPVDLQISKMGNSEFSST